MKNKIIIYLLIIFILLCFLFLCYYNLTVKKFDLEVFGYEEAIDAHVYIDGSYSGKMKAFGGGSHYSIWLPYGTHVIEVKKEGYQIYKEIINVKETASEHYLSVELVKE